ncbi:SHOCT domain-containing protein [Halorubrum ezzemoulense]|uniref:SHOCT domain-containing protein n=1 Tax=Halorubrum ezzemoulense TaxID=337243 RepID=UPI002330CAB6|nr:SHOCT domain-containing protein [Halorubrum ezzemoulense]MDB2269542.1 SHOCT domain-containing protein [Halorubrum ezzemoulense]MDB9299657.1 SHOCT domain-containing protein [Halorubrum ezzemoulense]
MALPAFEKKRLIGLIAILSFGLTSLSAVLLPSPVAPLGPAIFITGFFILIPLVVVLGEDFPLVAADDADAGSASPSAERPVAALRERYANGEIDEAEFERRLDRLLATEDLDERFERTSAGLSDRSGENRAREYELE